MREENMVQRRGGAIRAARGLLAVGFVVGGVSVAAAAEPRADAVVKTTTSNTWNPTAVGIKTEVTNLEWAQWLSEVFTDKNYDLTIISHTEPNDIDIYSRKDYYFNYDNPAFDKVIEELNQTSDEAKRTELYKQAQKILADDAVNGFLFELPKIGIWDAKVEGLWENSPIQANDLTTVKWVD